MTNREVLATIKGMKDIRSSILELAEKIIESTFDYTIDEATDVEVLDDKVKVHYGWRCRGDYGRDVATIPIEWFDEGFDYKKAYDEYVERQRIKIMKEEAAKKKLEEEKKNKEEYETYLKLKEKYESKNG